MLSIVIPIYNEEENLPALHERIRAASAASVAWRDDCEVILVDDGSSDRSPGVMKEMARADSHFKVINLSRNFGHQAAISAGLKRARGSPVVIMDGDLQDPPEELDRFLEQWRAGYDVVYAVRRKRKEPLLKRAMYAAFYRVLQLVSNIRIPLDSGDFCVMDRKVVDVLVTAFPENLRFVRGLRAYAGFRQMGVPYERASRCRSALRPTSGSSYPPSRFLCRFSTWWPRSGASGCSATRPGR